MPTPTTYRCKCGWSGTIHDTNCFSLLRDVSSRIMPGEFVPAGGCPNCDACLSIADDDIPNDVLENAAAILSRRGWTFTRPDLERAPNPIPTVVTQSHQTETSVHVKDWNLHDLPNYPHTHQIDIDDQRREQGQAYMTVGSLEGQIDEQLCIVMQVDSDPIYKEAVPSAVVYFDGDNEAFSLFKVGNKIILRPASGTTVTANQHNQPNGSMENLLFIE